MNTLDRFIRIIYKELPLEKFTNLKMEESIEKKINESFKLNKSSFEDLIKEVYRETYPTNYSPDEIDSLISWMKDILNGEDDTLDLFIYIVDNLLFYSNGEITVSFDNLLEWNGFLNKADLNVYYSAFLALKEIDNHQHKPMIKHDNFRLNKILREGISENHMHLKGSGYTSDMNWYYFNTRNLYGNWKIDGFIKHKYVLGRDEITLAFDKLRIIRLYLYQKTLKIGKDKDLFLSYRDMEKLLYSNENFDFFYLSIKDKITMVLSIVEDENWDLKDDPLKAQIFERRLLNKLFTLYLNGELNNFEVYLFSVYILGLSKFKMFFNQDNDQLGFDKFKYSEDIKEAFLPDNSNEEIYKSVFDKYYSEGNISNIEFRIGPKKSGDYYSLIDQLDKINKEIYWKHRSYNKKLRKINYAIIVHYIKGDKNINDENGESRKEKFYYKLKEESKELSHFFSGLKDIGFGREEVDYYANKIVGIDTANFEINYGPEFFGELFRTHKKETKGISNLRFTYHVGEDFNTLCNGMRAIDEVLEYLQFQRGDRLGHALALGIEAKSYYKSKRYKIASSLEEYLDDIVWMFHMLKDNNCLNGEYSNYLISKYETQKAYYCFDSIEEDVDIYDYYNAYILRGDNPYLYGKWVSEEIKDYDKSYEIIAKKYGAGLNSKSRKHKKAFKRLTSRKLFYAYHFSEKLKKSGQKRIMVDVDHTYIEIVEKVQLLLRRKIYNMEIAVESNPSSNRKISYIDKYIDLPMLKLNKYILEENHKEKPDLLTFINTDDSAIFQTDLSMEYAYVVAALMREGYDKESIYDYIDYLRRNSIESSFLS